ncbi:hypothetical protein OPQ81_008418 [Rhizoctonia solani]|nr:hypothetical protein OPQ81_008418 [Rhizoctonia solani]
MLDLSPLDQGMERLVDGGGFCNIYRHVLPDGKIVAVKALRVRYFYQQDEEEDSIMQKRMEIVIGIWAKCRQQNIVQLIGKTNFEGRIAAVYGWLEYGNVVKYLVDHPSIDRYQLSAQICEGVMYLHDNQIIHGNLKGSKIAVTINGVPQIRLCTTCTRAAGTVISNMPFTLRWVAPERLQDESGGTSTFASDVYSLGMTILASNYSIYPPETPYDHLLMHKIVNGQHPPRPMDRIPESHAGNLIWDILNKCWSYNPENRPSAGEVVRTLYQVTTRANSGLVTSKSSNIHSFVDSITTPGSDDTYEFVDSIDFRSKLVVREGTSLQDLVSHFDMCGLTNYTESLKLTSIAVATPFADTALANVYRIKLSDQQHVAVKCVKHMTAHKKLKRAARELSCWSSYKHKNILPLLGFAVVKGDLAMVSPWMDYGCVTDYVMSNPDCNRLALCTQVAQAIAYLHEHNVVHGDIKGPNVLVSDAGTAKVTDFGVSIVDHQEIEFSSTTAGAGTQRWQSPEILLGPSDTLEDQNHWG